MFLLIFEAHNYFSSFCVLRVDKTQACTIFMKLSSDINPSIKVISNSFAYKRTYSSLFLYEELIMHFRFVFNT
jgi:hypothetical protein